MTDDQFTRLIFTIVACSGVTVATLGILMGILLDLLRKELTK